MLLSWIKDHWSRNAVFLPMSGLCSQIRREFQGYWATVWVLFHRADLCALDPDQEAKPT
jgi:hypothetical protein